MSIGKNIFGVVQEVRYRYNEALWMSGWQEKLVK